MRTTPKIFRLAIAAVICPASFAAAPDAVPSQHGVVRVTNRVRTVASPVNTPPQPAVAPGPPITPSTPIRPSSTFSPQTGTFSRPDGTFSRPESTFSQPQSTFQRPASTFERPRTAFERPQSTFERPKSTFELPGRTFHRPVATYLYPPTTIVDPGFLTVQNASATEPVETQIIQEEAAPTAPEKVIVLDLPPGARVIKPAPAP